jgi:hypothetical protein
VATCFVASANTWIDEAEPIAFDKIAQTAGAAALRVGSVGALRAVGVREKEGGAFVQSYEGAGDGERALFSRAWLGFVPGEAIACFSLCVDREARCAKEARGARATGPFVPPPPPSPMLRALVAMVHHPSETGWGLAGFVCALGTAAVATRKRTRRV